MYEEKQEDSNIKTAAQTANAVKGAIKTGKALSGAAKGASIGGPYGAVAGFLWENRGFIKKILPVMIFVFLLPVLFILMLPSLIFNGLNEKYDVPIMNNDAAIIENINEATLAIHEALENSYNQILTEIQAEIESFDDNTVGEINSMYADNVYIDGQLIISQYCAYEEDYTKINIKNFKAAISEAKDFYNYTKEKSIQIYPSENDEDDDIEITVYTYTVFFIGEEYFGQTLFDLTTEQRYLANNYAQNLMLFIYGSTFTFGGYAQVSEEVLLYEHLLIKYAEMYGIPQYAEILKAIMMTESGGAVPDVMQSSECVYNTQYPKKPNGITDPEYSIDCGVHYFADCLELAGCTSPTDRQKLSLALQGYNFGTGYITWAQQNYGGYSESNALIFSNVMKQKLGWSTYGNPKYVATVFKYYIFEGIGGVEGWSTPFMGKDWRTAVTSEFGYRNNPISGKRELHDGIDIAYPSGTPINAVHSGQVVSVIHGNSGFGNHVVIDHGDGTTALYGHCKDLLVTQGSIVQAGQVIATVGRTGYVTGNHLHLTIKENGTATNPRKYIKVK